MSKKFCSYLESSQYNIGLTSKTVYIYDRNNKKVKRFKDIPYGYTNVISTSSDLGWKSENPRIFNYRDDSLTIFRKKLLTH